jgi:hypothetical protein
MNGSSLDYFKHQNPSHLRTVGADAEVDLNRAGILVEGDRDLHQ